MVKQASRLPRDVPSKPTSLVGPSSPEAYNRFEEQQPQRTLSMCYQGTPTFFRAMTQPSAIIELIRASLSMGSGALRNGKEGTPSTFPTDCVVTDPPQARRCCAFGQASVVFYFYPVKTSTCTKLWESSCLLVPCLVIQMHSEARQCSKVHPRKNV